MVRAIYYKAIHIFDLLNHGNLFNNNNKFVRHQSIKIFVCPIPFLNQMFRVIRSITTIVRIITICPSLKRVNCLYSPFLSCLVGYIEKHENTK